MFLHKAISTLLITLVIFNQDINAQVERICATARWGSECELMQRGSSEVMCHTVQDSIECAQAIRNGTADFGVFSAESALLVAQLGWDSLLVVKELRHDERISEPVDFQSVAIGRKSSITAGLANLKGLKFCHPGLFSDRTHKWSERFLKHFEREVVTVDCNTDLTSPAEIEAATLENFFGATCRPGIWSNNVQEDATLKEKYPNLCAQCDNPNNCTYSFEGNSHKQALNCLTKNNGDVTYVSLQEAQKFFNQQPELINDFEYICPNGSLQSIFNNSNPCVWLRQPWKVIISNTKAINLAASINRWTTITSRDAIWERAVTDIITADSHTVRDLQSLQTPRDHINPIRPMPAPIDVCSSSTISNWCTTSPEEREKCNVLKAVGITTGILPAIECPVSKANVVTCLSDISAKRADFMGIDSNYGYLARHPYNLTAALYAETDSTLYSSVVLVVRNNSTYTRFENFRNARACFPEFSGIASVAFINIGKNRGIFDRSECNYAELLGTFFDSSCLPGARDDLHDPSGQNPENLCSLCQSEVKIRALLPSAADENAVADADADANNDADETAILNEDVPEPQSRQERSVNCHAGASNRFYGTRGALTCLKEVGDLAILEAQNLAEHASALNLNPNDFRIMCRNGSLADRTGFNVDKGCYLTQIVDGEIVVRRGSSKIPGIINALSSFDRYLVNDPDFKMYNIFNGIKNLLFEDSTLGLVSSSEENLSDSVVNYINLFTNLDSCVDDGSAATIQSLSMILLGLCSMFVTIKNLL